MNITNASNRVWDEITYAFPKFNGFTLKFKNDLNA